MKRRSRCGCTETVLRNSRVAFVWRQHLYSVYVFTWASLLDDWWITIFREWKETSRWPLVVL